MAWLGFTTRHQAARHLSPTHKNTSRRTVRALDTLFATLISDVLEVVLGSSTYIQPNPLEPRAPCNLPGATSRVHVRIWITTSRQGQASHEP